MARSLSIMARLWFFCAPIEFGIVSELPIERSPFATMFSLASFFANWICLLCSMLRSLLLSLILNKLEVSILFLVRIKNGSVLKITVLGSCKLIKWFFI